MDVKTDLNSISTEIYGRKLEDIVRSAGEAGTSGNKSTGQAQLATVCTSAVVNALDGLRASLEENAKSSDKHSRQMGSLTVVLAIAAVLQSIAVIVQVSLMK